MERHNFISKLIVYPWVAIAFLVIFTVVYAPVIQIGYFFSDDYLCSIPEGVLKSHCIDTSLKDGRYLHTQFLYILSTFIKSSESTKTIRLIGIIGIALFASVTYAVFKRCRFRSDHAFLMSALICTLPFIQVIVSWMSIVTYIYSALLSSLSALLLLNAVYNDHKKKGAFPILVFLTAIILLIAALCIYQPFAMMYWAIGVIFFLSGDNSDFSNKYSRQHLITYFFIGFISFVIYYFVVKMMPFIMDAPIQIQRARLVSIRDIPKQLIWFLIGPLPRAMNLWIANPTYIFASFIGVIIFTGIIINTLQEMKKECFSAINYVTKNFLISIMVALSYLPKLITVEHNINHETSYPLNTLLPLATVCLILLYFGFINIVGFFKFIPNFALELRKMLITILLTILTVVTAFSAHNNVKYFAMLRSAELEHIKNTIKDYGVSNLLKTSKMYIRRPPIRRIPRHKLDMYNEFKAPLTTAPECGLIPLVTNRALHDIGIKPENILITHGDPEAPIPENKNLLIIDMTPLDDLWINTMMKMNKFGW